MPLETFLPDLIQHVLNLIVMFAIVKILIYKPVSKFMAARADSIETEKKELEKKNEELKNLCAQYQAKLDESKDEAAQLIRQCEEQAKAEHDRIVSEGKERAEEMISNALEQIASERKIAVEQMRDEFSVLAVQIASKILKREVSQADNKAVIDEFFEKVG